MAKPANPRIVAREGNDRIVGIRLTLENANAFKTEAAKRGLRANQLFMEMWEAYKLKRPGRT